MRVLLFSQYYWPEPFPITAQVARLRATGVDVTVLTGKPNYPGGTILESYRAWGTAQEWHGDVEILRVPMLGRGQGSALRLMLNYIIFILSAALFGPWLLRGRAFDAVLVYAPSPLLQALPAIIIARLKRARLLVWVQDLWPESLSATGFVTNRFVLGVVKKLVRIIYRNADRILVQSRAFIRPVAALSDDPKKIHYLPNPVSDLTPPAETPPATQELAREISEHVSIVFAGNFGRAQALDTVLNAARQLHDLPGLRVVLIGSGHMEEWVRDQVVSHGLEAKVLLPGRFPPEHMPVLLSRASALLVTLQAEEIFSYTVPSKVQTYLAMGRPIIAALDGEGAALLKASGAGLICPAGDSDLLAKTIRTFYDTSQEERAAMGQAGKVYFETHFAPAQITRALSDHLEAKGTEDIIR